MPAYSAESLFHHLPRVRAGTKRSAGRKVARDLFANDVTGKKKGAGEEKTRSGASGPRCDEVEPRSFREFGRSNQESS